MSKRFARALVTLDKLPPFRAQLPAVEKTSALSREPLREIITAELYLVKLSTFRRSRLENFGLSP